MMKRILALACCALLMMTLSACGNEHNEHDGHNHGHVPTIPPVYDSYVAPEPQDATGSIFLGTWNVSAQKSIITKLVCNQNGTLKIFFDGSTLGGMFFDDGQTLTLHISQHVMSGPYVVNGDTITVTTKDDVLVLTKVHQLP